MGKVGKEVMTQKSKLKKRRMESKRGKKVRDVRGTSGKYIVLQTKEKMNERSVYEKEVVSCGRKKNWGE